MQEEMLLALIMGGVIAVLLFLLVDRMRKVKVIEEKDDDTWPW